MAATGVDGLPYLPYTAHAWYPVTYKGQTYCYRLAHPSAAEYQPFNAQSGTTRNFRWQLSGKIPGVEDYKGTGFYGGALALRLLPTARTWAVWKRRTVWKSP